MTQTPVHDFARYAQRRAQVLDLLGDDGVLILAAAPELHAGRDTELRYIVDSDLFYLTGYEEPEAVLVLGAQHHFTLFVRPRDADREVWTGVRGGVEAARDVYGADNVFEIAALHEQLPPLLEDCHTLFVRTRTRTDVDLVLDTVRANALMRRARRGRAPLTWADPALLLDELRLRKDSHELQLMRTAAGITVQSFAESARCARDGIGEWELEAAIEYGFRRRGASGPAFPTIAGSSVNATTLHYVENARRMKRGELVLVDAGARYAGYCADVSRTFPVDGSFSPAQRALYDAVLAAHDAAIAAARPGVTLDDVHLAALTVLTSFLVDARLLSADIEDEHSLQAQVRAFYPHKTSHWLGLDVHDAGDYVVNGAPRVLEPGMVFTVEPGLYINALVEHPLRGTGVRIEDDVLITDTGCEVLTQALPVRADDVERLVRGA